MFKLGAPFVVYTVREEISVRNPSTRRYSDAIEKKRQQLQVEHAPRRQLSPVALFSRRARTWIVAACSIAIICFVLLPLGLDRLSSANTQQAVTYRAADASAPTPEPEAAVLSATATPPGGGAHG